MKCSRQSSILGVIRNCEAGFLGGAFAVSATRDGAIGRRRPTGGTVGGADMARRGDRNGGGCICIVRAGDSSTVVLRTARSSRRSLSTRGGGGRSSGGASSLGRRLGHGNGGLRRRVLLVVLASRGDLSGLDSAHLGDPGRVRLYLTHRPELIRRIPRDSDVVASLDGHLQVAGLKYLTTSRHRQLACHVRDIVNEGVGDGQCGLLFSDD